MLLLALGHAVGTRVARVGWACAPKAGQSRGDGQANLLVVGDDLRSHTPLVLFLVLLLPPVDEVAARIVLRALVIKAMRHFMPDGAK